MKIQNVLKRNYRVKKSKKRTKTKRFSPESGSGDRLFVLAILVLMFFGIVMVYDSSVAIAIRDFSDPYRFVKEQMRWLLLGFISFSVFSKIDYHKWQNIALHLIGVTIVLLVAVFLPGIGVHALGANRWINLGFFVVQPAEFAKLAVIIYLATWLPSSKEDKFLPFLMLLGVVIGLIILEPDLGTSIILTSIALLMYFLSGAPLWQFGVVIPGFITSALFFIFTEPYRLARLTSFLDPNTDPQGSSYQIKQILLSLGSGGLFGVGIGKSKQKYEYLPEANTDSIFAIIGEEVGFVGAAIVMLIFLFIISRGFAIAERAPDSMGRLLVLGITSWLAIQVCINLAAMVALVPLTGVPLPLISYGGSSLIIMLSALGIILNVSRQSKKK